MAFFSDISDLASSLQVPISVLGSPTAFSNTSPSLKDYGRWTDLWTTYFSQRHKKLLWVESRFNSGLCQIGALRGQIFIYAEYFFSGRWFEAVLYRLHKKFARVPLCAIKILGLKMTPIQLQRAQTKRMAILCRSCRAGKNKLLRFYTWNTNFCFRIQDIFETRETD